MAAVYESPITYFSVSKKANGKVKCCTSHNIVEMLGIEPRSNGISLDILRAQLTLNCRESFAGQRPKFSVVDLNFPHHHQRMNSVRPTE